MVYGKGSHFTAYIQSFTPPLNTGAMRKGPLLCELMSRSSHPSAFPNRESVTAPSPDQLECAHRHKRHTQRKSALLMNGTVDE